MSRFDKWLRLQRRLHEFSHLGSRNAIYSYSIENNEYFWKTLAESRLLWERPFETVCGSTDNWTIEWFKDGQLNVADNCITRHLADRGEQTALIWEKDEESQVEFVSFNQLAVLVSKFGNVLKSHGVTRGDRVAIYYPVSPIGVAAMLACAKIGAIHSVVFAGFSAEALRQRVNDADCSVVICSDGTFRGGRYINLKSTVDEALEGCPGVQSVLVGTRNKDVDKITTSRDFDLDVELAAASSECKSEIMNAEDPLFLLYTSGSTGKPKGLIHTQAGYLLYTNVTSSEVFDMQPGDVFGCVADIGWITGHSYVVYGPLSVGATTLLFESIPTYPDSGRYWRIVEKHKLTQFYGAPTAYRTLMTIEGDYPKTYDTSSLKCIGTVGEPINREAWHWLHNNVGKGEVKIVDTWWQTETGGVMITPKPYEEGAIFKPGSAQLPFYGIDPVLMSEEGQMVRGNDVDGQLCIRKKWPGIARTIYNDHQRFIDTYLNVYNGMYFTGDGAHRDVDGEYTITGRLDDVINISGHRLGTAEIEDCLTDLSQVTEAAVVGIPDKIKGQTSFAFVILKTCVAESEDEIRTLLNNHVSKQIAKFAVPAKIIIVSGLPKTRSGKIMRRILRQIAINELDDLGDITTLAEPEIVNHIIGQRNRP